MVILRLSPLVCKFLCFHIQRTVTPKEAEFERKNMNLEPLKTDCRAGNHAKREKEVCCLHNPLYLEELEKKFKKGFRPLAKVFKKDDNESMQTM